MTREAGWMLSGGWGNIFPPYGDDTKAWSPRTEDGPREHLVLGYNPPIPVVGVAIFETYYPGAMDKVLVRNAASVERVEVESSSDAVAGSWTALDANDLVIQEGSTLAISRLPGNLMQLTITGDIGLDYQLQISTDLVIWINLTEFRLTASPHLYIDPSSSSQSVRFYRLRIVP